MLLVAGLMLAGGCLFRWMEGEGGGQTKFSGERRLDPGDIALPRGYVIEPVVTDLTFPTDVAFDEAGRMYVVEAGYSYLDVVTVPRLLRVAAAGRLEEIARGDNPPWSGVDYHDGNFYIAGGHVRPGQILEVSPQGQIEVLVDGLPTSVGDHHTNGPRLGPDGWLYFGQGTLTNSAVVGEDNWNFGWVGRYPDAHDVPCRDVVLAGRNFTSPNPLTPAEDDQAVTGSFMPFGVASEPGQVVPGQVPCGGAVMRVRPTGGELELVAWGLRNPWGLAWRDGQLYVTENQYDVRGSRPVFGTGDLLWRIEPGTWYGWPDFWAGVPLSEEGFEPPDHDGIPGMVLAEHPGKPPEPAARFGVHSSSNGIDISRSDAFGHVGQAFVAQFGDMAPNTGKVLAPVGYKVVRVEVDTGVIHDFAINVGETNGPASWLETGGLERPVNVRFGPDGRSLYVVDFGVMTTRDGEVRPRKGTGAIWKITRRAP